MLGLLFGFRGRIARGTYWTIKLSLAIAVGVIVVAVMRAGHARPGDRHGFDHALEALPPVVHGAVMAAFVLVVWIVFAAHIKRLHDLDMSGWRMFGTYWKCLFQEGTNGTNRYGPDPLVSNPQRTA